MANKIKLRAVKNVTLSTNSEQSNTVIQSISHILILLFSAAQGP